MDELGQLEARHAEFTRRGVRVVAVSLESEEETAPTVRKFPHLLVAADREGGLCAAAGALFPHGSPGGNDIAAPTTVLVDGHGTVRWIHRPPTYLVRLPADEVLAEVDRHLVAR